MADKRGNGNLINYRLDKAEEDIKELQEGQKTTEKLLMQKSGGVSVKQLAALLTALFTAIGAAIAGILNIIGK